MWINISRRGRFFPPLSLFFFFSPLLSRFWYQPSINGDWTRVARKYRGIIAVNSIEKFHYQRENGGGGGVHPLPLTSGSATIARVIGGWERRARLFEATNLSDRLTKLVREGRATTRTSYFDVRHRWLSTLFASMPSFRACVERNR